MISTQLYSVLLLFFFVHQAAAQIQCGDNSTYCPTDSTCCPLEANTRYGCCPIPNAVCCADKLHCCPSGMTCDTAHARCTDGKVRLPMYEKKFDSSEEEQKPSHSKVLRKVGVPLKSSQRECGNGDLCSGESTCCYHSHNDEAYCCPGLKAKCCRDAKKCCPHGFVCSDYGEECIREKHGVTITMQMFDTKLADEPEDSHEENELVTCPDGTRCPHKNTCCHIGDSYSCCSLTHGKCCESYCCPSGYSCSSNGQCEKLQSYSFF